jgi:hypothetical protein
MVAVGGEREKKRKKASVLWVSFSIDSRRKKGIQILYTVGYFV